FVVTGLLSSCAERIGPHPATPDTIRRLTVGDRDFLMLELRKMTLGKKVNATLICPNPDCGQKMDIAFSLDELPVKTHPLQSVYRFESWQFRLPQGSDQEALANLGDGRDESRTMVHFLLSRCLVNADRDDVKSLPESAVAALESAMERVAPKVEFQMDAACPECAHEFTSAFDPASFFLDELLRSRSGFDREIHLLSFHYHWPLGDILALTRGRRHRYLRSCSINWTRCRRVEHEWIFSADHRELRPEDRTA